MTTLCVPHESTSVPAGFRWRSLIGIVFALLVILLAGSHAVVPLYPFGRAVYLRPLLAGTGIAGAICLLCGIGAWRVLLPLWCIPQTCIIATDLSREWFYQGVMCGHWNTTTVRMNHQLTQYQVSGVNWAGPVLLVMVVGIVVMGLHPPIRWRFRWTLRRAFVAAGTVVAVSSVLVAMQTHRYAQQSAALYVIDLDGPAVPIYYRDKLLGHTPLCITPELIRHAGMPLDLSKPVKYDFVGWAESVCLSDGTTEAPLYAGVPWMGGDYVARFDSPWGERCRMHVGGENGNWRFGQLYPRAELRGDPVLKITSADVRVKVGGPMHVRCELTNPTMVNYVGREAHVSRHCFSFDQRPTAWVKGKGRYEVVMPASWNHLPPGGSEAADVEYDAPTKPGEYELFCDWFLFAEGEQSDRGSGGTYSNILRVTVTP